MTYNKLTTIIRYIVVAVASFLLGYSCYPYIHKTPTVDTPNKAQQNPTKVTEDTTISVSPKRSPEEPDLVINNRYIAEVNGETIEIPKKTTATTTDPKDSDTTARVSTTIDLDPVVRKLADAEYKRNWEVSTGLGRSHDGHYYVPIGVQRNYNYDRALEFSIGVSKDHIENAQVVHKWRF